MSKRVCLLASVRNIIGGVFGMLGYVVRFIGLMLGPKAILAAKLVALESQLAACHDAVNRKKAPKPRFSLAFRALWIAVSKWLPGWKELAHVM